MRERERGGEGEEGVAEHCFLIVMSVCVGEDV